jgi:hypothetical protein
MFGLPLLRLTVECSPQLPDYQITRLLNPPRPPAPSQGLKDLAHLIPSDARVAQPPSAVARYRWPFLISICLRSSAAKSFFRSRRCRAMTAISAIPTPAVHPTRSQSSQFGVGFRIKDFIAFAFSVSLCLSGGFRFCSFQLPDYQITQLPISRGFVLTIAHFALPIN